MNEYFCSVGDKLSKKIPDKENTLLKGDHDINPTAARFTFSPMQPPELLKAIHKFKTSQGSGLDRISSLFLKAGMPILAQPLRGPLHEKFQPGLSSTRVEFQLG